MKIQIVRDYKRHQKEPFAIARNLFSDIFDRRDPIGLLTDAEIQEIDRYWDSQGIGVAGFERFQIPIDVLAKDDNFRIDCAEDGTCTRIRLPPNKFKRIADARDAIVARFGKKFDIGHAVTVQFVRDRQIGNPQTEPHFDDMVGTEHKASPNYFKVTIPVTETRATLMRSCNQEDEQYSCTATLEEDIDNTPLLSPGDAQIFRPGMHMHAATTTRQRGSVYFIYTGWAPSSTIKNIVGVFENLRGR